MHEGYICKRDTYARGLHMHEGYICTRDTYARGLLMHDGYTCTRDTYEFHLFVLLIDFLFVAVENLVWRYVGRTLDTR